MTARTRPLQSHAEKLAERHARTFMPRQIEMDSRVPALVADGFNAHQIAGMLRLPMIDVRLMLAAIERRAEAEWLRAAVTVSPTRARMR